MIDKISIKIDGVEYCSVRDDKGGDCSSCTFECDTNGCLVPSIFAGVCCDESIHWEKVMQPTEQKRQYTVVIDRVTYNSVDATRDGLTCKQCDFYCQQCTFPQHHTMRDTCSIHDLVWKKTDMEQNTKTGHKHAELMLAYATESLTDAKAYLNWEVRTAPGEWFDISCHPLWHTDMEYRRKPRTVLIDGIEVPKPEITAPKLGTMYWSAEPTAIDALKWNDDKYDARTLDAGLVHLTKDAADQHRAALFGYNKTCCGIK